MSRILTAAGIFILVFATSLWAFFPFGSFVESTAANSAKNMGLNLKYESVQPGIFSTSLTGVIINNREIGDFTFRHTPFTLLKRSLKVSVKGIYNAEAVISDSFLEFDVSASGKALDFIKEPVSLAGNVNIKGSIDIKNDTSQIRAQADKMLMSTPLGELEFENVSTDVDTKGKIVTINHIRSDDKNELNMKGSIKLNRLLIEKSDVSLNGSIKLMGQKRSLTIAGNVSNLHPILN